MKLMLSKEKIREMNCKEVKEKLWSYAEKELDASESEILERHLETCNTCSRLLQVNREALLLIEEKKKITANPFLYTRVMAAVEGETRNSRPVSWKAMAAMLIPAPLMVIAGIMIGLALAGNSGEEALTAGSSWQNQSGNDVFRLGDLDEQDYLAYFEINNHQE